MGADLATRLTGGGLGLAGCILGWALACVMWIAVGSIGFHPVSRAGAPIAAVLFGACPGLCVGALVGGAGLALRSAIGSIVALAAGVVVAATLEAAGVVGEILVGRISAGSPVASMAAGIAAGAIWGSVSGGWRFGRQMALVGLVAGPISHVLAVRLATATRPPTPGVDPAGFVLFVCALTVVLASLLSSAAAGALYPRGALPVAAERLRR